MSEPTEPLTVLTVEQKNMLADETNPNCPIGGCDEGPKPKPMATSPKGPRHQYIPKAKSVITVLRSRFHDDRNTLGQLCLPILLIWLLLASFFTGVLFYRHVSRQPTYYGWCGTKFVEDGRQERLTQRLEIDPEELYERIQVPRFGSNRPAIFVHDFRKNITAIVDILGKRCFIKPLDRNLVAPPKSFIDLVEKLEKGYYEQNPRVIHETFRVGARLTIDELLDLDSQMVTRQCLAYDVFSLEPASRSFESSSPLFVRNKREARSEPIQFSVMNGENVEVEKIVF